MRWVFISLMLFNAAFLSWRYWVSGFGQPAARPSQAVLSGENLPIKHAQLSPPPERLAYKAPVEAAAKAAETAESSTIQLLEEIDEPALTPSAAHASIPARAQKPESVDSFEHSLEHSFEMCYQVGPFDSKGQRDKAVAQLRDKQVHVVSEDKVAVDGWRYWVYLQPESTRKEAKAKLARVQAMGVDSYLIRSGDLLNGVSLGLYSSEALSSAKLTEYRRLGLAPKVSRYPHEKSQPWLLASTLQLDVAAASLLDVWRSGQSKLQVIQKKCELPVASH